MQTFLDRKAAGSVRVDTDRQPYMVTLGDPVHDDGGTHLTWRVVPGRGSMNRAGFAVYRGVGSSGAVTYGLKPACWILPSH